MRAEMGAQLGAGSAAGVAGFCVEAEACGVVEEGLGGEIGTEKLGIEGLVEDDIGEAVVGKVDPKDFGRKEEVEGFDGIGDDGGNGVEGEFEGYSARFSEGEVGGAHQMVVLGWGDEGGGGGEGADLVGALLVCG